MIDDMDHDCPSERADGAAFLWSLGAESGLGNWFFDSAGGTPPPNASLPPATTSFPFGDAFLEAIVPPRGESIRARHAQGEGIAASVDLFVQLMHPQQAPVDLSAFAGIAFWAKLASSTGRLVTFVRDRDPSISNAYASFFVAEQSASPWFAQSLFVSDQWRRFVLLFDDFRQGVISGHGSGRTLDTHGVTTIDFVTGIDGEPFDLWIDDLAVLCRGSCPQVMPLPTCP